MDNKPIIVCVDDEFLFDVLSTAIVDKLRLPQIIKELIPMAVPYGCKHVTITLFIPFFHECDVILCNWFIFYVPAPLRNSGSATV